MIFYYRLDNKELQVKKKLDVVVFDVLEIDVNLHKCFD